MARTNKETSRIAWAGMDRGLKMLVTPVGTSAANVGSTRKVVAIKRKEAAATAWSELFFLGRGTIKLATLLLLRRFYRKAPKLYIGLWSNTGGSASISIQYSSAPGAASLIFIHKVIPGFL